MAELIGFIGLGAAGVPIAENLLAGGFRVRVFDADASRMERFAERAGSAAEAARGAELTITMLPGAGAIEEAMRGVAEGAPQGAVALDLSTTHPDVALRVGDLLERAGVHYLDGAIMGVPAASARRDVAVLLGGDPELVERFAPVFAAIGTRTHHVGGIGDAKRVKIANNTFSVLCRLALYEVATLLRSEGVELEPYLDVLRDFWSRPMSNPAQRLLEWTRDGADRTGSTGRLGTLARDVGLAVELAEPPPLPLVRAASELLGQGVDWDLGDEGPSSMAAIYERLTSVSLQGRPRAS